MLIIPAVFHANAMWMRDLKSRVRSLEDQMADADSPTEAQRREFEELGREQGQLADLVLSLLEAGATADEDNPQDLPDIREDLDNEVLPVNVEEDN